MVVMFTIGLHLRIILFLLKTFQVPNT